MKVLVEMKRKYSLKCLKIEIDVLHSVFEPHTLWVFPHLNVSASDNICCFISHLWIAIDCYLSELLHKMTLRRHKFTFSLPKDIKN